MTAFKSKLVQLVLLYLLACCSFAQLLEPQTFNFKMGDIPESPKVELLKGSISFALRLKWDALWNPQATFEEVSAEEREEYVEEALQEIAQKMKRKHGVREFKTYELIERKDELCIVKYPKLSNELTDSQLKAYAL